MNNRPEKEDDDGEQVRRRAYAHSFIRILYCILFEKHYRGVHHICVNDDDYIDRSHKIPCDGHEKK